MPDARNCGAASVGLAEAKVIAHRIMARHPMSARSQADMIHIHKFNTLLADAQKLAGFVLEREMEVASG